MRALRCRSTRLARGNHAGNLRARRAKSMTITAKNGDRLLLRQIILASGVPAPWEIHQLRCFIVVAEKSTSDALATAGMKFEEEMITPVCNPLSNA
jgi:hypothetical protein